MGIVTKTGDKGKTSLFGGRRVNKDSLRIEACGVLDELSCFLGVSRSQIKDRKKKKFIEAIQKDLFNIGTEIAAQAKIAERLAKRINRASVRYLEEYIDRLERKKVYQKKCFHIPGQNLISANLDISRAVSRKLERRVVTLRRRKMLGNGQVLVYLNRLSDLLFLLARFHDKKL